MVVSLKKHETEQATGVIPFGPILPKTWKAAYKRLSNVSV
jgi:hypothetical protein